MKNSRSPPIGKSTVMLKCLPVPTCPVLSRHWQNITSMPCNNCHLILRNSDSWCFKLLPLIREFSHLGKLENHRLKKCVLGRDMTSSSLASNSPLSMNQKTCFEDSKPCLQPSPFQNRFLRTNKHGTVSPRKVHGWVDICKKKYGIHGWWSGSTLYGTILQACHFITFTLYWFSISFLERWCQLLSISSLWHVKWIWIKLQLKEQVHCSTRWRISYRNQSKWWFFNNRCFQICHFSNHLGLSTVNFGVVQ